MKSIKKITKHIQDKLSDIINVKYADYNWEIFLPGLLITIIAFAILYIYVLVPFSEAHNFNNNYNFLILGAASILVLFLLLFMSKEDYEDYTVIDILEESTGIKTATLSSSTTNSLKLNAYYEFKLLRSKIVDKNLTASQKIAMLNRMKDLVNQLPESKKEKARRLCEILKDHIMKNK